MRFLNRLLKTPEEEQDETQDEFDAEEKGLLMIPSLPGGKDQAPPSAMLETVVAEPETLAAEGTAPGEAATGPDQVGQPPAGEGGPPSATQESPPAEDSTPETAGEGTETEASPDDPMHMFRASAKRTYMAAALTDGLEDVSIAELLAEARSLRAILGGEAASDAGQGKQKVA